MSVLAVPASIFSPVTSLVSSVATAPLKAAASVGLSAVSAWMVGAAEAMLHEVVNLISAVTTPSLSVSWFSDSYWRVAGLAMLLTVPFLFAAAVQAVVRADMGVLIRAAFFDLPVAVLSVTLAAPLITLLLAATDEMCTLVTGSGPQGANFLNLTAGDLSKAGSGALLAVIAVLILLAGLVLTVELIMRSAAIYIVVLFLPLGFAAMVWPARRVWIKRMLELLIALILSKFAMVAILSLAVAGLTSVSTGGSSLTTALSAMALMILAAFSPWALLRLLPFTELAADVGSMLHTETREGARRGIQHAANAKDAAAGLTVDPVMAGVTALANFATGGTSSSADGRGGRGGVSLTRRRAGELPPASGSSGGGGAGDGGGPGGAGEGQSGPAGGASIYPTFDDGPAGPMTAGEEEQAAGRQPDGGASSGSGQRDGNPATGAVSAGNSGAGPVREDTVTSAPGPVSPMPRGLAGSPPPSGRSVHSELKAFIGEDEDAALVNLADGDRPFMVAPENAAEITPEDRSEEGSTR